MAQKSWFFNSAPNDPRIYQASDFAQYFGKVLSTGLLHINEVPGLQVKASGADLRTYVEPGGAIMEGYAYENTDNEYLNHSLPEVSLDRIDRIVLRLDKKNANRYIRLFVLEGEPSTEPIAPTLQRDNLVWELSIAQVRIRANTSTINPSDVFDERLDRTVCGLVFSLISKPALADIQTGGYAVTATVEGQTDFEIPLQSFDKVGDGLTVFVGGKKAEYSSYQVLYPRTVRFSVGLPLNTKVEFEVIRGVLKLEDDYVVNAGEVGIIDAGGYFESENVEGALQKIGLSLYKAKPLIYGVEIDESNSNPSTSVTYIEDAANISITKPSDWDSHWPFNVIKPCVVQPLTNQFVSYLNPNNFAQRENGTPIDITSLLVGDVFIEIPQIWVNIKRIGSSMQIRISPDKVDEDWFAMAHQKGNTTVPYIYIGAYVAYKDLDNKLRSLSGKVLTATANNDATNTRLWAQNNNCDNANYYQRIFLPNILFWFKYKNRDPISVLGEGLRAYPNTGTLNTLGMDSNNSDGVTNQNTPTKFLGLEHILMDLITVYSGEFIEGLSFNKTNNHVAIKTMDYSGESDRKIYELRNSEEGSINMIIQTQGDAKSGLFGLIGGGSSTTYYANASQAFGSVTGTGQKSLLSIQTTCYFQRIVYRPTVAIH